MEGTDKGVRERMTRGETRERRRSEGGRGNWRVSSQVMER